MVTFPCWSPHFILLLSHSWWVHWELPQLWCLCLSWWIRWELPQLWCVFYEAANPLRCWGSQKAVTGNFSAVPNKEVHIPGWLWDKIWLTVGSIVVVTNSLLRKGWGSQLSHSKPFGLTALGWKSQGVASLFWSGGLAVDSLKQKADQCLYKMSRADPQCQAATCARCCTTEEDNWLLASSHWHTHK